MSVTAMTKARFLALALLVSASLVLTAQPTEAQRQAPDFQATDLEGRSLQLSSLKGCGVVLYFFASWCPYCERQTPLIVAAHQQLRRRGVIFLGINVYDESEEDVRAFMAQHGITFPTVMDRDESISDPYRIQGVPHAVLISPQGTLSREISGWSPRTDFVRLGRSIAGGKNCKIATQQIP